MRRILFGMAVALALPVRAETVQVTLEAPALTPQEHAQLLDAVVSATTEALSKTKLALLSVDTVSGLMAENLSKEEMDKACTGESCAIDTAQKINVSYLFEARAPRQADGKFGFTLRLHKVLDKSLLASTRPIAGATVNELVKAFEGVSHAFYDQALEKLGGKTPWRLEQEAAERKKASGGGTTRSRQQSGTVAVLPPVAEGAPTKKALDAFHESVTAAATRGLGRNKFKSLTKTNVDTILKENGFDAKASPPEDAGRLLGATGVVTITITQNEDETLSGFVRYLDVVNGDVVASSTELRGANVKGLSDAFAKESDAFFKSVLVALGIVQEKEPIARRDPEDDRGPSVPSLPQRNPTGLNLDNRLAIRAGLGSLTGVLGVGAEYRFGENLAVAIGYGSYFTLGASFSLMGGGRGGPYIDAHYASTGGERPESGVGATVGWDVRLVPWLSLKAGVGGAWTSLSSLAPHLRPLVLDAAIGMVF